MLQMLPQLRHLECCMSSKRLQETLNMPHLISATLRVCCEEGIEVMIGANSKLRRLQIATLDP